jgi:hypothetical protein
MIDCSHQVVLAVTVLFRSPILTILFSLIHIIFVRKWSPELNSPTIWSILIIYLSTGSYRFRSLSNHVRFEDSDFSPLLPNYRSWNTTCNATSPKHSSPIELTYTLSPIIGGQQRVNYLFVLDCLLAYYSSSDSISLGVGIADQQSLYDFLFFFGWSKTWPLNSWLRRSKQSPIVKNYQARFRLQFSSNKRRRQSLLKKISKN